MWRKLKGKGIIVPRQFVRLAMLELNPQGVEGRRQMRLRRRQYLSPGQNFVWHIDGYDKLKPYGFAIQGAIDRFLRRMLWLDVGSTNNNPNIIAKYILDTVIQLNTLQCILRCDRGTEKCSSSQNSAICKTQSY